MTSRLRNRVPVWMHVVALSLATVLAAPLAGAQAANRFIGTITEISGTTLTVKTDAGEARQVEVPGTAVLKRVAPGQKDLSAATPIEFSDLAVGDRALVKLDPAAAAGTSQALQVIAVKQSDVAQKQQKDRDDWQRRGVGGLVKSVDPAAGVILVTSGAGTTAKTVTVNTTKATMLKRYAPASVRFDAATPGPIDAIHVGDQLRARGAKNADGTQIDAEEVISGTFRNISGVIAATDAASSTLTLKDLATKKQVTIHVTADAQMRRLPEMMGRMLAARLKGTPGGGFGPPAGGPGANGPAGAGMGQRAPGQWTGGGGGQMPGGGPGGADPQQMLTRLPLIPLTDLKKGDAVMLVSTDGTTDVTAITLLAGVEPLLEAPAASQNFLNSWSMGTGAPDSAAQ